MENKEKIRSLAENVWAYIAAFLRWGVLGLLVGGLGGFVGALFAKSVAWATAMRGANPWLLYLLPVGGLAICGRFITLPRFRRGHKRGVRGCTQQ